MSTNEFYFLVLVCGAFGGLAAALAAATIRYHQWQKQAIRTAIQPENQANRHKR
jgi:hypothetical protein